ncbi:hypothetical protein JCM8547_006112 [Rhodosporidiobolus lusitaniae]
MTTSNPALRPITLPSLPADLSHLAQLKQRLVQANRDIQGYKQLQDKLQGFTDEPTWDAFIPLGPLAYVPGKLVHTNDITQLVPPSPPFPGEGKGESKGKGGQKNEPKKVLRSAKQAREEAARLQAELEARIPALKAEIAAKEEELKAKREAERKAHEEKNGLDATGGAIGGDEDWSVNERGELINEEGLPMFDIREDLPPSPPPSTSDLPDVEATKEEQPKPKMRYLVKKGGKQVVRPLPPPSGPSRPAPKPAPSPSSAPPSTPSSPKSASAALPVEDDGSPQPGRLSQAEIKSLLDELEAEEQAAEAEAAAAQAKLEQEEGERAPKVEQKEEEQTTPATTPATSTATAASPAKFAGFSAGFLSKSKQKRPSNTLTPAPPMPSSSSPPQPPPASSAPAPPPTSTTPTPLKSALSRPSSPAPRSIFDKPPPAKEKKSVAWDLPAGEKQPERENVEKVTIVLGMGGEAMEEVQSPAMQQAAALQQQQDKDKGKQKEKEKENGGAARPIRETVVERPMKAPVPPSLPAGLAVGGEQPTMKRVSRFRKAKEEVLASSSPAPSPPPAVGGKGKGRAVEPPQPFGLSDPSLKQKQQQQSQQQQQPPQPDTIPGPVHTISLSSKPTASSSTSSAKTGAAAAKDGVLSYADIDFDSDEEDPDLDSDGEDYPDWDDDEEGDEDEEDFDVDSALHQREVALAYHAQRMRVGAGRGTGALGGFHEPGRGETWEENVGMGLLPEGVENAGIVPATATLQSLLSDPSLTSSTFGTYPGAGTAQLGHPSRFRQANRHLESAQLIIPSMIAADPTLRTGKEMLGPALGGGEKREGGAASVTVGAAEFTPAEEARLARTLAALAEGRALPEDEQRAEREREVLLREEYAREKVVREERERVERMRSAGKAPPMVASTKKDKVQPVSFAPRDPSVAVSSSSSSTSLSSTLPPPVPLVSTSTSSTPPTGFGQPNPDGTAKTQEEELAELLGPTKEETRAAQEEEEQQKVKREEEERRGEEEGEKPKRMSRFRQKQLGLID